MDLALQFNRCSALSSAKGESGKSLVDIIREVGGRMLGAYKGKAFYHPNPTGLLDDNIGHSISRGDFDHPNLARSLVAPCFDEFRPSASLWYARESGQINVSQQQVDDAEKCDAVAHGQLSLANMLYPKLHPRFGFIDESGENQPSEKNVAKIEYRSILWANFFGPAYVDKYGRDFLLGAPGWKKQDLDDGGVLYVATKSFFEWCASPPEDVVDYFRSQIRNIKVYRARLSDW